MPVHMYNLTVEALKRVGKEMKNSKIAMLGWLSFEIRTMPGTRLQNLTGSYA